MVQNGFANWSRDSEVMSPATRNTTVRGPEAASAARSEPAPESFRFVTSITMPPRPPTDDAPLPCAPGKAAPIVMGGLGFEANSSESAPTHPDGAESNVTCHHGKLFAVVGPAMTVPVAPLGCVPTSVPPAAERTFTAPTACTRDPMPISIGGGTTPLSVIVSVVPDCATFTPFLVLSTIVTGTGGGVSGGGLTAGGVSCGTGIFIDAM